MMPKVFDYLDYRVFVQDVYHHLVQETPGFSKRAFARICGSSSPNYLQLLLERKIGLTPKALDALADYLKLTPSAKVFLENLVNYDQAKTFSEREKCYLGILQAKLNQDQGKVAKSQHAYYSKWYHSALRSLFGFYVFNPDTGNFNHLGSRLNPPITGKQAQSSVKLLLNLGLLVRDDNGNLKQTQNSISSGPGTHSLEIYKFQSATLNLAREALEKVSAQHRDFSTLTLNISGKTFTEIQEKIKLLRKEIIQLAAQDTQDDRVYQVNFQLFPLSKIKS